MKIERKVVTTTTTHHETKDEINYYCCAGMRHLMSYIGVGHRYLSVSIKKGYGANYYNETKELKDFPMRFCPFCGEEIEVNEEKEYVVIEEKDKDGKT